MISIAAMPPKLIQPRERENAPASTRSASRRRSTRSFISPARHDVGRVSAISGTSDGSSRAQTICRNCTSCNDHPAQDPTLVVQAHSQSHASGSSRSRPAPLRFRPASRRMPIGSQTIPVSIVISTSSCDAGLSEYGLRKPHALGLADPDELATHRTPCAPQLDQTRTHNGYRRPNSRSMSASFSST